MIRRALHRWAFEFGVWILKNRESILRLFFHLGFWCVIILIRSIRDYPFYPQFFENIMNNAIVLMVLAPFMYFHIYVLVRKFLLKRRFVLYFILLILLFCITVYVNMKYFQFLFGKILKFDELVAQFSGLTGLSITGTDILRLMLFSTATYFIFEWFRKERLTQELKKKTVESELNFLKMQLEPHFLFNNLNSIYFLLDKEPEKAKDVILKLSDILSHQLYLTKDKKILLSKELKSLENYIQLQQIRHEDFLSLEYDFIAISDDYKIAPMILLTFIENAFKHSQNEKGYHIKLKIDMKQGNLVCHFKNSIGKVISNHSHSTNSGVGLKNVKRRLALIYPNQHQLEISSDGNIYTVKLNIQLTE